MDIRQVSLAFEQSGRIEKLLVQEGDKVKAGQVLATLNTNSLEIQAKQAQAQLKAQQEAIVKQHKSELGQKKLVKQKHNLLLHRLT